MYGEQEKEPAKSDAQKDREEFKLHNYNITWDKKVDFHNYNIVN